MPYGFRSRNPPLTLIWILIICIQFATTPFKGAERKDTFNNIMNMPVHFRETPKVSS